MTKVDGRGKAPKAGKGVGRKPLAPELKKAETKTVSIRLPVSSIKFHRIDGAWLFDAVLKKIESKTGWELDQPYDPDDIEIISDLDKEKAELKDRLLSLLSTHNEEGGHCYKDEQSYQIAGILKDLGVL